jgi:hypothetical protein
MQTFLTYASQDFTYTAKSLDRQRLNKQALEAWQIMMTNLKMDPDGNYREPRGWRNHPAVKMWDGYEITLYKYIKAMTDEWHYRGYYTSILSKAYATVARGIELDLIQTDAMPLWMRDQDLYSEITQSHRVALLVKDYNWYSQWNWPEDNGIRPDSYDYVWV